VHELSDFDQSVTQLSLPQPDESTYCYGYDGFAGNVSIVPMGGMAGTPIPVIGTAGTVFNDFLPQAGTGGVFVVDGAGGSMIGAGGSVAGTGGSFVVGGAGGSVDPDEPTDADAGMADQGASL